MNSKKIVSPLSFASIAVLALSACAPGGSGNGDASAPEMTERTEPVSVEEVEELGDVTLTVWADAGEEAVLEAMIPEFEATYDNVTVDLSLRGWNDLMATVVNAMAGENPPDVAQGNTGYEIMQPLIQGDMIRPLDDVADVYDLTEGVPESAFDSYRWDEGGESWGGDTLYALGGATQPQGLFYNVEKLEELGLEAPQSFEELEEALEVASEAGELPIQLGNSDQYPLGAHVMGALFNLFAEPEEINAWIAGEEGATFDQPGIRTAVEVAQSWNESGYFPPGYDGKSLDDAVSDFGEGEGVFFIGGSFNGSRLSQYDPEGFGFTLLQNEDDTYVTTGTLGTPWHISSRTELEPAAIAFVGMLLSAENAQWYADDSRLPNTNLDGVEPLGTMHENQLEAANIFFESGEFIGFLDWASPGMQDTLGAAAQELLAGRITADEYIERVQADWTNFHGE